MWWMILDKIERDHREVMRELRRLQKAEPNTMEADLADKQALDRLTASVTANTNATKAAHDALMMYAQSNADLISQLQDAIESGDQATIKATADAIEANTASLVEATPKIAQAVTANTPAAAQPA